MKNFYTAVMEEYWASFRLLYQAAIWAGYWNPNNISSQCWAAYRLNFKINGPGVQAPSSRYVGGCHFGLVDGAVRFLSENIDGQTFESLVTRDSGEVVGEF